MAVRKAFLSSTGRDLAKYRNAVCRAINGLDNWKCVRMEDFGARTRPAEIFDEEAIRACDLFIGILGHCHGSIPKGQRTSYTEKEYKAAIANNRPRLMFLAPNDFPVPAHLREDEDHWKRQKAFRARVQADDLHASFSTPHELAHAVLQAIKNWEDEERRREEEVRLGQRLIDRAPTPSIELDGIGKRLLTYPITYIQELFELVSGPKRFIARRRTEETLTIERALGFLTFSTLISWSVPLHHTLPTSTFTGDIFFIIAQVMMYALAVVVAWRIVGGSARLLDYLTVHFYYSSISGFIIIFTNRVHLGLLRATDETIYEDLVSDIVTGSLIFNLEKASDIPMPVIVASAGGTVVTYALLVGWFVVGWGAYRAINGVSRRRSLIAAIIFLALAVPIVATLGLVASALLAAHTS